jgi:CHAT domain-containing protein
MADLSGIQLHDLPQTRDEVQGIGKILGQESVILLGKDATETAFKKEPLDQFRILHLAVRGVFPLPPLRKSSIRNTRIPGIVRNASRAHFSTRCGGTMPER